MANTKPIKQSVLNTFARVGIAPTLYDRTTKSLKMRNRFSGEGVEVSPLVARCVEWVYNAERDVQLGNITVSDFDRVRYFVLAEDSEAYMTLLD